MFNSQKYIALLEAAWKDAQAYIVKEYKIKAMLAIDNKLISDEEFKYHKDNFECKEIDEETTMNASILLHNTLPIIRCYLHVEEIALETFNSENRFKAAITIFTPKTYIIDNKSPILDKLWE